MLHAPGRELRSEDLETLTRDLPLTRGLGRSYGDSSLPAPQDFDVAGSVLADRLLAFDESAGILRAEAGFSLEALVRLFLPRGFFTPVTPGTRYVTLGGMVAADVHGKNHHVRGCFGEHVRALKLRVATGEIVECSPTREPDLFRATVGGMGLTGHILEVEVALERVPSPWIWFESERVPDIDTYVDVLKSSARDWPMTVGWIDCLTKGPKRGRGVFTRGRWATREEAPSHYPKSKLKITVPFLFPSFTLNPLTLRVMNFLYYWKHLPKRRQGVMSPDAFFYPLDGILHWNRVYGRRGMTQYQCVLPDTAGPASAHRFVQLLTDLGGASFVCVIKDCGSQGSGLLSFPMPGISLAVDMPVRSHTQRIVDTLNEFVLGEGGRIYLAKDRFTRREHFARMESRLEEFLAVKRRWDPHGKIRSAQSVRLLERSST
jgi:decaprenylphospho-beta-D-ribofuranose 2-oxidase